MTDIKIVDQKGEEIKETVDNRTPEQLSGPVDLLETAVAQVMGLEDSAERARSQEKIHTLIEYAKSQTEDHSPESIKWVIRSLELKLGTPPFSEKRINYVAQYAYLMTQKRKLEKDIKSFEQK